jgi:hypothetical protein
MKQPMKRVVVVIGLGLLPLGLAGSSLAKPPVGGCPTNKWILAAAPAGDLTGTPSADVNGDGLSCYLEEPKGSGIFTIIDNTVVRP